MRATITLLLALALSGGAVCAQDKTWKAYLPPDSSFSVELPAPLRRVKSFEGEHGASLEPDQEIKGVSCYAAIETTPRDSRFGIIVVRAKGLRRIPMSREEFLRSLSYTFLADDDETQYMREPVSARQGGLSGKEYLYVKDSSPSLFTRGRVFDAGGIFYVLVYVGRDEKDLASPDAERFLNSFRPRGRAKGR
jgi:hypothetical protein